MQWIIWPSAFLLSLTLSPAFAWRCDHGLVNIGDSTSQVRKNAARRITATAIQAIIGAASSLPSMSVDITTIVPGFYCKELRFHKRRLETLDTPGYGFRLDTKHCARQDISIGMSAHGLASRCGKPNSERDRYIHISGGNGSGGKLVMHREDWTYNFGSQYLLQKVSITSGRVRDRETLSPTKYHSKQLR
ncbi:MAG TPA: DUF2845 domain-containing protein [Gammaproteobacteria bacterium]|nr:DUF2845 domain-containing protein [Gammaproteobacteria bacterium]